MGVRKSRIRDKQVVITLWIEKEWADKFKKYIDPYAKYGEAAIYRRALAEWLIAKGEIEPPKV